MLIKFTEQIILFQEKNNILIFFIGSDKILLKIILVFDLYQSS